MIYEPKEDSYLLEKEVVKLAKGKKVLDIGSGSGIQANAAFASGAKEVIAVDIDTESVEFLRGRGIKAIKSDLFSDVKGKFDLIVFNPPYLPEEEREDKDSKVATSGGERGDEIIVRFLNDVDNYLNRNGSILIVVSSLTPKERINKMLRKIKMKYKVLSSEKFFMEKIEIWMIERVI
ncbi:MAG: HemK2/MTQ2 family protein methyltransferase [Nanoarchaeota archaeon]